MARRLLTGVLIALAVSTADAAAAPVGELAAKGCFTSQASGCASNSKAGLTYARGSALTADGRSIFVAATTDDALAVFDRDPDANLVSYRGCLAVALAGCGSGSGTGGIDGAADVAVTADGRSVYVVSFESWALAMFDRDPLTGNLTYLGCFTQGAGCIGGGDGIFGLRSASGVAVSPDGRSVYVAGFGESALVVFGRDPSTREVEHLGCFTQESTGCGARSNTAGLSGAADVAVSPDNGSVYVASPAGDALALFDRDAAAELSYRGCFAETTGCGAADGTPGLDGGSGVTVTPDNRSVLVASTTPGSLASFHRDPATRGVAFAGCFTKAATGCAVTSAPGLAAASDVTASADNRSVYVTAEESDAVVTFDRDPLTRALTQRACFTQQGVGCATTLVPGLDGARSVAVSPDGRGVFVAADAANALAVFDRVPDSPPACAGSAATTAAGAPVQLALGCADPNGDPLKVNVVTPPGHGAVTLSADGGSATYTPAAGFSGADGFAVQPVPASGPAGPVAGYAVTVTPPPGGPPGPGPTVTPRIASSLSHSWTYRRKYTVAQSLTANAVTAGTTLKVGCKGRGCPPKRKLKAKLVATDQARVKLVKPLSGRKLRVGAVVSVRMTKPGHIGRLLRYTMRSSKQPKSTPACLSLTGATITCPFS